MDFMVDLGRSHRMAARLANYDIVNCTWFLLSCVPDVLCTVSCYSCCIQCTKYSSIVFDFRQEEDRQTQTDHAATHQTTPTTPHAMVLKAHPVHLNRQISKKMEKREHPHTLYPNRIVSNSMHYYLTYVKVRLRPWLPCLLI